MQWSSLFRYIDASLIHRALEPNELAQAAGKRQTRYAAMEDQDRRLGDAAIVGALKAVKFSREHLDYVSGPTDVLLGDGNARAPNAKLGIASLTAEVVGNVYTMAVAPRLVAPLQPVVKTLGAYLAQLGGIPDQDIAELKEGFSLGATELVVQVPLMASLLALMPAVHLSLFASSWVKIMANTPAALVGAAAGAAQHIVRNVANRAPHLDATEFGERGARNDETFALFDPISRVPDAFFFLSEDKFGFDVRELALLAQNGRPGLNPHTNMRFSDRDLQRLVAHPSELFGDGMPSERMNGSSLLSPWQWSKLLCFFFDVSRALQAPGASNQELRASVPQALRLLLQRADPISRVELELLFQIVGGCDVARLMRDLEHDEDAAYQFGERLYRMSMTIGIVQRQRFLEPQSEEELLASVLEAGPLTNRSGARLAFASLLEQREFGKMIGRVSAEHNLRRYPWLKILVSHSETSAAASQMPPINLSVPELTPPAERQFLLDYLHADDDGTHDIAAMLRAQIMG